MWSDCETEKKKTAAINQGEASEVLAYLVRERNKTSQTRKIRKTKTKEARKAERWMNKLISDLLFNSMKYLFVFLGDDISYAGHILDIRMTRILRSMLISCHLPCGMHNICSTKKRKTNIPLLL